jgi:hypothetical protein
MVGLDFQERCSVESLWDRAVGVFWKQTLQETLNDVYGLFDSDRVDVIANLYLFVPKKSLHVFDRRAVYGIPHPHVGLPHTQQAIAFFP